MIDRQRLAALGVCLLALATSSSAGGATSAESAAERQSVEDFAKTHATCREWSDGCMVCLRGTDGHFACSLPGIACQPRVLACGGAAPTPK